MFSHVWTGRFSLQNSSKSAFSQLFHSVLRVCTFGFVSLVITMSGKKETKKSNKRMEDKKERLGKKGKEE